MTLKACELFVEVASRPVKAKLFPNKQPRKREPIKPRKKPRPMAKWLETK
jgi:hypothetical protein